MPDPRTHLGGLAAARAEGRIGGRRRKLDAGQRKEIAESIISGRKSGAEMARLYDARRPRRVSSPNIGLPARPAAPGSESRVSCSCRMRPASSSRASIPVLQPSLHAFAMSDRQIGVCATAGVLQHRDRPFGENPEICNSQLRDQLQDIGSESVEHEAAEDIKQHISFVADRRLTQLGLLDLYGIKPNLLSWIDDMLNVYHVGAIRSER